MLNLARGFQGIGGAMMFATSLALLAQEFQGAERATAFGIWGATIGAAVAVGPLVGGALTEGARLGVDLLRERADRGRSTVASRCRSVRESTRPERGRGSTGPGSSPSRRRSSASCSR